MRRFFRFSIRDLLWLTLVVGLAVGWFVRERRLAAAHEAQVAAHEAQDKARDEEHAARINKWRWRVGALETGLKGLNYRVQWEQSQILIKYIPSEGWKTQILPWGPYQPSINDD